MRVCSLLRGLAIYAGFVFGILSGISAVGAESSSVLYAYPAPVAPEVVEQTQEPKKSLYIGILTPRYPQSEVLYPSQYPWTDDFIQTFDDEGSYLKKPGLELSYRLSKRSIRADRADEFYKKGTFAESLGPSLPSFNVFVGHGEVISQAFIDDYDNFPPTLPVVMCGRTEITPEFQKKYPRITGVVIVPQIIKTIELGLKLFHNPREIIVITDDVDTDPQLHRQVQEWIVSQGGTITPALKTDEGFMPVIGSGLPHKTFGKNCKFILINAAEIDSRQMIEVVKKMPPQSFIVMSNWRNFYRDNFEFFSDMIREMDLEHHPLFSISEYPNPQGALGGYVSQGSECAKKAVSLVRQIFDSPPGTVIPPIRDEGPLVIDEDVMRRFHLDLDRLPPETILLNETCPVWVAYRTETLIGSFAFGVVLILLIGMIILHRRYVHFARRTEAMFNTLPLRIFAVDAQGNFLFQQVEEHERGIIGPFHSASEIQEEVDPLVQSTVGKVMQAGISCTIRFNFRDQKRMAQFHRLHKNIFGKDAVLWISQDITAIAENERKLEAAMNAAQTADRAKSYFIAMMSHELRTPLNSVIGFSQLLQMEDISFEEQKEYVGLIYLAGNNLLCIINDILDLSKMEADQLKIVPQKTELEPLLNEIGQLFKLRAKAKGVQLNVQYPPSLPILFLDKPRLRQVLVNLMGNATKFTTVGSITLSAEFIPTPGSQSLGKLFLRVADTGIGIKKEYQNRVFEPFVQADEGVVRGNRSYGGTGLGLTISRRIITIMGGTISLESEEFKGSTFTIELPEVPFASPAQGGGEMAGASVLQLQESGRYAIIVDDVEPNLQMLEAVLKKLGFETQIASSGLQALEMLRQRVPDILLTDLWMPQMTGVELVKKIRSNPAWAGVKLLAITADVEAQTNFDMKDFDGVIYKPFTLEKLKESLDANLKK